MNVSSIFVGRETGDIDGLGDGVGVGGLFSLSTEGIGDDCAAGEISFCGVGVLLGVGDFAAFDGVGVGDLRASDGEDFDLGVGGGLGTGVWALRSKPI